MAFSFSSKHLILGTLKVRSYTESFSTPHYHLAVNGGQPPGTSTFGTGWYLPGATVPVSASYGGTGSFVFNRWSDDISYLQSGSGSNPNVILSMPSTNIVLTAIYTASGVPVTPTPTPSATPPGSTASPTPTPTPTPSSAGVVLTTHSRSIDYTDDDGHIVGYATVSFGAFYPGEGPSGRYDMNVTLTLTTYDSFLNFARLTVTGTPISPIVLESATVESISGPTGAAYRVNNGSTVTMTLQILQFLSTLSTTSITFNVPS